MPAGRNDAAYSHAAWLNGAVAIGFVCLAPLLPPAWFWANSRTINRHHLVFKSHGGSDGHANLMLIHSECHRQHHARSILDGPKEILNARP